MFKASTGKNTSFIKYSAFLGGMYLGSQANEAQIAAVKSAIGDEVVKKGFTGLTPESSSGRGRAMLKEQGIEVGGVLEGVLKGVAVKAVEGNGRTTSYLQVAMASSEGNFQLSIDLGNDGAQTLVRKLFNVADGETIAMSVFATYAANDLGKYYANHGASVKVNGTEVPAGDRATGIGAAANAATAKLEAAGVTDSDVLSTVRRKAQVEFCVDLINKRNATLNEKAA